MLTTDPAILQAYAADASGLVMRPEGVVRASTAEEVVECLREASRDGTPVTAAGAQTSTTAASITERGVLLSLGAMDRILDLDAPRRVARVQPGVRVAELKRAAAAQGLLFAPDPTSEEDATIGGAIACNASGARSLWYGATRPYVRALTVVLASGELLRVRRTPLEKNTVGYALAHEPVDWFVGSEGTLGVVVEAELALLPLPAQVTGLLIPFRTEAEALAFVVAARASGAVQPRCLEFFDGLALAIAREAGERERWAREAGALVYVEQESGADEEPPLDEWLALAERHGALDADILALDTEAAIRDARRMRHAVPATMNERGARQRPQGGRKVSTDWAVPHERLHEAIGMARRLADEAGVPQAVIYGHAGNGHPHQNFIAHDGDELARITTVVEATLRAVIAMGGTIAAEHGVGKLKRHWVSLQMTPWQLRLMQAVKRELDPQGLLAPGNVL